jgi:hypothetical protein
MGSNGQVSMKSFRVQHVVCEELADLNCFVAVLYERPDGTGERLELQRALVFDDQDRATGMDTYCISISSGASQYGGVRSWSLEGPILIIHLDDEASEILEVEGGFRLHVDVPPAAFEGLVHGLERVFGVELRKPAES